MVSQANLLAKNTIWCTPFLNQNCFTIGTCIVQNLISTPRLHVSKC
jgi:hypothetical protein